MEEHSLNSIMHSILFIWAETKTETEETRRLCLLPWTNTRHGENAKKIVYCQHKDLVPKFVKKDQDVEEKQKLIQETKAALHKITTKVTTQHSNFIKYKPSSQQQGGAIKERIIRLVDMSVDPIELPKFKHNKVPRPSGSPPVPLMHSPPCPVIVKDQQDWKIPPCISNWKNLKGYTIPLDRRLAADGRGLQQLHVNDRLAKLYQALNVAHEKAAEALAMRSKVQKEMMLKEKEKKERQLQELASKARSEIDAGPVNDMSSVDYEDRLQEEKINVVRLRERRFVEAKDAAAMGGKKREITRDGDRDVSKKVVLGMASTSRGGDVMMYDQRLFNQENGMDSGFAAADAYNLYDKGLFTSQPTMSMLYKPKKDVDSDTYGGADEQQLEKIIKTDRFKPDKVFAETSERAGPRDSPVEFEEADPFGLDQLWTDIMNNMENDGSGGTMKTRKFREEKGN